MDNEYVKKLTGKNPSDFEFAATHIINDCDIKAFEALVEKSDFLFDFIKENVKKRLSNVINENNYKNLFSFLKIYSPDYEDLIISTFLDFADEEMTDKMLELLEKGSNEEKAYAAKYFTSINDSLAIDLLRKYSYSEFDALSLNCAEALSALKDEESYNSAIEKLNSNDEFEKVSAVRFLVSYKNEKAIRPIFETMKKSSMPENIASEIPYLKCFLDLLETNKSDTSLALNHILNGFGEIIPLEQVFDFQLYELINIFINSPDTNSYTSVVLLNAKLRFEQLTENDEYIFDESKIVKEEIYAIKDLLNSQPKEFWETQENQFVNELNDKSEFVFSALEIVQELSLIESLDKLKGLLTSHNQTIILKTVEVIKSLNKLNEIDKNTVLEKISDENIKIIIQSLFA